MQLKERFLNAVVLCKLGKRDENGVLVELQEFIKYFSDIPKNYAHAFLPAATIEIGQYSMTNTKYVFRVKKGIYRVHPDAINQVLSEDAPNYHTRDPLFTLKRPYQSGIFSELSRNKTQCGSNQQEIFSISGK